MKNLTLSLLSFLILFTTKAFTQNYHFDYQDGIVIFQLKETAKIIPAENKIVDYKRYDIFRNIMSYPIVEVKRLHPTINDVKLRRTYQIELVNPADVNIVINLLERNSSVEYAEMKEFHRTCLTPNDPNFGPANNQAWGLYKINAQQAWDISTGSATVKVAVTDNAMNINHPDLVNKMLPGHDATTGGTNPNPCGGNDGFHGSHVSGIVGAQTNNGIGVASIGYNVSIIPVKIGRCSDGALTAGYEGITWAADNDADVINMSWGGGGSSNYGQNVCNYAWGQGCILVAAAGNDNQSTQFYPAAYNNVIAVASTTTNDSKSSFSQYGTWIDISAPGSSILSTNQGTGYQVTQGTSMASPMVAGLVGLIKSHAPNATNSDIINCLYSGAVNINSANPSFIGQLGIGRINAYNSLVCASAFNVQLDAGITSINSPNTTVCGTTFTPVVVIRNFGSNTLTSATINYNWNGTNATFNWTGNLATGQTANVNLPVQTASTGNYTFIASTSNPNGAADQNPSNNQVSKAFSVDILGQTVNQQLTLDCFGSEISWQINNDQGTTVYSGSGYTDTPGGQTINNSFCLPVGCYTFSIADTYGDGMYGAQWQSCSVNGNYQITNGSGTILVQMTAPNAAFGNGTSHSFCIVPPNINNDAGISQIISPTGFICSSTVNPIVELKNFGNNTLTSCVINYLIGGVNQTFNWTGNLATGQVAVVTLPSITATQGSVTLNVSTTNPNGTSDDNAANNGISKTFSAYISAASLPFVETFETDVFATGMWTRLNSDNDITWELATVAGSTPGNKAAKIDFFNYQQTSQRDGMLSPKISLAGYTTAQMTFHHAYRRFNQTAADSLVIYISDDCGATFDRVFAAAENGTGTFATAVTSTVEFTPSSTTDWCFDGTVGASCFTVNLNSYVGQNIIVMFESFNAGTIGNNLYIDNINIDGTPGVSLPTANFTLNNNTICEGQTVTFTDQSASNITGWNWSFPGGNPATSTIQNPTVTYPTSGNYDVTLQVTNSQGNNSSTQTNAITVNATPSIAVNATQTTICEGDNTQITATGGTSYTWNNGLSMASTHIVSPTVTTTYTASSSNSCGSDNASITINVNTIPNAPIITQNGNVLSAQLQIGETVQWLFNGNVIGTTNSITINQQGSYTAIITNANGCTNSTSDDFGLSVSSINDWLTNLEFILYPNPTNGLFELKLVGLEKDFTLEIVDVLGRSIVFPSNHRSNEKNISFDISNAESGIYFIIITIEDKRITKKITLKT